jgi:hypothetical protein
MKKSPFLYIIIGTLSLISCSNPSPADVQNKDTIMGDTLFFHEDDYCMIELTPKENIQALKDESDTINAKAEKNFDGNGYKDIHVIKDDRVKLNIRKINPNDLEQIINKTGFQKAAIVTTGYGQTYREERKNTFGFGKDYSVIYFSVKDGSVDRIWFTNPSSMDKEKLTSCLSEIGQKWDLVLMDWFETRIVNLADKKDIDKYLSRQE